MPEAFVTQRRIEFRDTDGAGIAHFSNFFAYMEQAEHALLRHVGLSVVLHDGEATLSWPRVHATCDYFKPARFEDLLDVRVQIERLGEKSVTYGVRFELDGELIAAGRITSVCCRFRTGQAPESIRIPDSFVARIRPYLTPAPATGD